MKFSAITVENKTASTDKFTASLNTIFVQTFSFIEANDFSGSNAQTFNSR
jgi:hypothetical protein